MGIMSSRDLSLKTTSIPNDLDPEELAMWKLAYTAGIIIPIEALKSIYELCKFGCDPKDIANTISQLCKSYTDKKESIKLEKNTLQNNFDKQTSSGQGSTTGS